MADIVNPGNKVAVVDNDNKKGNKGDNYNVEEHKNVLKSIQELNSAFLAANPNSEDKIRCSDTRKVRDRS